MPLLATYVPPAQSPPYPNKLSQPKNPPKRQIPTNISNATLNSTWNCPPRPISSAVHRTKLLHRHSRTATKLLPHQSASSSPLQAMAMAISSSAAATSLLAQPSHYSRLPGASPLRRRVVLSGVRTPRSSNFVSAHLRAVAPWSLLGACEHRCAHLSRLRNVQVHAQQAEETTSEQQESSAADDEVCELVNGFEVEIGESEEDGFSGYYIQALKNNNGAGVLLLSDVFGYESSGIRDFVYRLACVGYNVLIPDLFRGDPWDEQTPPTGEEFETWRSTHTPERIAEDIDTSTAYLKKMLEDTEESSASKTPKYAVVGFCIGGGQTIQTVARQPTTFTTAVSFYGTRIDPNLADAIQVPLLLISGDSDSKSPVDVVKELEKRVAGSKAVVYAGRGHAFVHQPDSLEDDEAAEDAFTVMRLWLKSHLVAPSS